MTKPVEERPQLPRLSASTPAALTRWSDSLSQQLAKVFQQYGYVVNLLIKMMDGGAPPAPQRLKAYNASADLPAASAHEGAIVYVKTAAAGAKFKGSDGTSWVNLG